MLYNLVLITDKTSFYLTSNTQTIQQDLQPYWICTESQSVGDMPQVSSLPALLTESQEIQEASLDRGLAALIEGVSISESRAVVYFHLII